MTAQLPPQCMLIRIVRDLPVRGALAREGRVVVLAIRAGSTRRQVREELADRMTDAELGLIRDAFGEPPAHEVLPDYLDAMILEEAEITIRPGDGAVPLRIRLGRVS